MLTELIIQSSIFTVAVIALFYIPGSLLQTVSGLQFKEALSQHTLRICMGLIVMPIAYWVMRKVAIADGLMLLVVLLTAAYGLKRLLSNPRIKFTRDDSITLLVAVLFLGAVFGFSHFADFQVNDKGTYYRLTSLSETTFHQGLVNALRHSFPPPALYASGSADFAHYHLNMHLQIEGLHRLTGIGTDRLVFWYVPFLYFLLLFLLPYSFVRENGGSRAPAVAAGILVFGAGFSFIPGLMGVAGATFAWGQFFHAAIFGIFTLNAILPALIALFAIISLIPLAQGDRTVGFWFIFGLMIIGSYGFKSSMGLQISGVLLATGVLKLLYEHKRPRDWKLALCSATCLVLMLIYQSVALKGFNNVFVELQPWYSLNLMLSHFDLENVRDVSKPAFFLLFFLLTMGVRLLGLFTIKGSIQSRPDFIWLIAFLLIFLFSGYVFADTLYIGDEQYKFNHAGWFAVQGLFAAWYLLFIFLIRVNKNHFGSRLLLLALIVLALPSSAQLLWRKSDSPYAAIGPDEQAIVEYFETTDPHTIVLHPLNQQGPSLASNLAGRSTVLSVFMSFVNESQGLNQRVYGSSAFFDENTDPEFRKTILNYYGVTHVYGPHGMDSILSKSGHLEKVLGNEKYGIWKVQTIKTPDSE